MNKRARDGNSIRLEHIVSVSGLLLLLSLSLVNPAWAQAIVTPDRIEVTLEPGKCADDAVTATMGEVPISQLDVALVIDVTSSMDDVIEEVTRSAGQIIADICTLVPDAAFALATLSDYPKVKRGPSSFAEYGESGDYPWRVDRDLTQDATRVQAALDRVILMHGGDDAEGYLRALYETQFLSWREGSRRIVVFFGDSFPHDPDPGRDIAEDTADDLTQEGIITQLAATHITVLAVHTNEFFRSFYEAVADGTGGQAFRLDRIEQIPQVVQQLVEATVTHIRALTLEPTSPGDTWLRWEPESHRDVLPLETHAFTVTLCVPEGTAGGDYSLDLNVTGDGATVGKVPVVVHVPSPVPVPVPVTAVPAGRFPWWWLIIPAVLLPLLGVLLWRKRRAVHVGPVVRPQTRKGSTLSGKPVQKPALRPSGADITHGRSKPSRRDNRK